MLKKSHIIAGIPALTTAAALAAAAMAQGSAPAGPPVMSHENQYTLFVYETPEELALRTDSGEKGAAYWQAWGGFAGALQAAGVMRGGMPLLPAEDARRVSLKKGETKIEAGPARGDLLPSGYFMIEVDSLDAALEWAAKVPNSDKNPVVVQPAFNLPPAPPQQ